MHSAFIIRCSCPPLPAKSSSATRWACTPGRRCSSWTWPTSSRREITRVKGGEEPAEADGKSVMQMIILAATEGTPLRIEADGEDAEEAVQKLAELFESKFGEE